MLRGAHLPDLHALLEHFEEDYIMVLAPNGKRVYPPEGLRAVPLHLFTHNAISLFIGFIIAQLSYMSIARPFLTLRSLVMSPRYL